MPKRRIPRLPARRMLWALGVLLALALLHPLLLRGFGELATVEDPAPAEADLIFLLNGNVHTRPFLAAELYREGVAPRVVLTREQSGAATRAGLYPNGTDVARRVLLRAGVPESAIVELNHFPEGTASTADEAESLRRYLRENAARRVVVVTSDYHTRRARWLLRRRLGDYPVDLRMAGAPEPAFDESNWWRSERGMLAYVEEALKFGHNLVFR